MQADLQHVLTILAVEDLAASLAFYRAAFGATPTVQTPAYVEFTVVGGQRIGLYEREGFGRNTGQAPTKTPAGALAPTELYFRCDDVPAAIERVTRAGARVLSPLAEREWGDEAAYFADPSGNVLVLARPAAGSVSSPSDPRQAVVRGSVSGLAQTITIGVHRIVADEPVAVGGTDTGPDPYELLLAALGACTSMTLSLYARRKQWPLERVTVRLRHSKIHADDCEDCEQVGGKLDRIEREVELHGISSDEQRARLLEIANKCPVHKTLTSGIDIRTRLV